MMLCHPSFYKQVNLHNLEFGILPEKARSYSRKAFGVNSEKRALAWQETYFDSLGLASDWDWVQNRKLLNEVRYHIDKRLSIEKYESRSVLPGAINLRNAGYTLIG